MEGHQTGGGAQVEGHLEAAEDAVWRGTLRPRRMLFSSVLALIMMMGRVSGYSFRTSSHTCAGRSYRGETEIHEVSQAAVRV